MELQIKTSKTSLSQHTALDSYNVALSDIKSDSLELSVYDKGTPASPETTAKTINALSKVFPDMSKDFMTILSLLINKSGITEERLKKSLEHLLLTHRYQTFKPADLLSYNPKVQLYDGNKLYEMYGEFPVKGWSMVVIDTIYGPVEKFCKTDDAKIYGLTIKKEY